MAKPEICLRHHYLTSEVIVIRSHTRSKNPRISIHSGAVPRQNSLQIFIVLNVHNW